MSSTGDDSESKKGRKELEATINVGGLKKFVEEENHFVPYSQSIHHVKLEMVSNSRFPSKSLVLFQGNSLLLQFSEGCTQVQRV